MIRLGAATLAAILALCLGAHAQGVVKSDDGSMQLTLPNGWKESKPIGPNTKIRAWDGHGAMVAVSAHPKADFKDFKSFTSFINDGVKKNLPEAEPKTENVQVDGKPAVRTTMSGSEPNGRNVTLIATCIDAGPVYVAVRIRAAASDFERQGPLLVGLANQLKISASAAAPPPPGKPPS